MFLLWLKKKRQKSLLGASAGLTVIEIVVVLFITTVLLGALLRFLAVGYPISKVTLLQQRSTETARLQLKRMAKVLREARYSDTGAYPLVEMSPQRIIFYSDIDGDEATERVRYELVGNNLERGVTEATGDPLVYDLDNEDANVVASSVRNGAEAVFIYYSGDYPADQTALAPVDLTEVKYIQFRLLIDADPNNDPPPVDVTSQVQLRNLKANLGET
ncbi:MAG: hypothetical protein U1C49_00510 [Candidatus Andersenbacteria bacterium]|nr:hypothetical protein [Candidatus Andersenbacteria bacterium]